jgi:hypothetical protein
VSSRRFEVVIGGFYRNSSGQIRRVLTIEDGVVEYRVIVCSRGHISDKRKIRISRQPGAIGRMTVRSFEGWAMLRTYWDGKPWKCKAKVDGRPRTKDMAPSIRAFFRVADGQDPFATHRDE